MPELPSVRLLLATWNGDRWLAELLASVATQEGVRVSTVASDDASTDGTPAILVAARDAGELTLLPTLAGRFGNANRNFLRLIRDTPVDDIEYFALADQDDLWLPGKLQRAVAVLRETGADAFSADVTAFWADGRRKRLVKSRPQRRYDHVFESAGPGCTFVLRRSAFLQLQRWVIDHFEALQHAKVHDWLIYAYAREHGWRWIIDDQPLMLYRQHERNEAGANLGWRAAAARWRSVRDGRFRRDVLAIGAAAGVDAGLCARVERLGWGDRLFLAAHVRQYRRSLLDCVLLAIVFLCMTRR